MAAMTGHAVFNDDSGRRAKVFQWGGRGFVVLGLSVVTAVGLTLGTQVSLPGLDQLRALDPIHRLVASQQPEPVLLPAAPPAPAVTTEVIASRGTTKASAAPPRSTASAPASKATSRAKTSRHTSPGSSPTTTAPQRETTAGSGARPAVRGVARGAKADGVTKPRNPKAATPGSANAQGKSAANAQGKSAANAQDKSASSTGKGKKPAQTKSSAGR